MFILIIMAITMLLLADLKILSIIGFNVLPTFYYLKKNCLVTRFCKTVNKKFQTTVTLQ